MSVMVTEAQSLPSTPPRTTDEPDCTLLDWHVIERFSRSQGGIREFLVGEVYGHPKYRDGTRVRSGPVVWRREARALTVSGTLYRLADAAFDDPTLRPPTYEA